MTTPDDLLTGNAATAQNRLPAGWLEEEELHSALQEAWCRGLSARVVMSCRSAGTAGVVVPPQPGSRVRRRLLLVDGDRAWMAGQKAALEQDGTCEVVKCDSARRALLDFASSRPHVLVLGTGAGETANESTILLLLELAASHRVPVIRLGAAVGLPPESHARIHLTLPRSVGVKNLLYAVEQLG